MKLLVTYIVTANFNEIYRMVFNYFKNNSVRIAYRESIILFEISFQSMGLKSLIEDVFLKDGKALSQLFFLLFRKTSQILMPMFFEDAVKVN